MTWPMVPLGELGDWYGGGTPSKGRAEFWSEGTIPWLSPKDMRSPVLKTTQDHITGAAIEHSAVRLVPEGSVAVVVRSGILERTLPVAVVPFATTLNQDMKALVPRPGVDPKWVAWGLRAFERELLSATRKRGTTVASIELARLMEYELPLPSLEDQLRIVGILEDHVSRLDAARASVDEAARRSSALMNSVLATFAEGPAVALGDLSTTSGYGTSEKCINGGPGPVVVRIPNLVSGSIDLSDSKRVADAGADVSKYVLRRGDLLIVRTNGSVDLIGRAAVVHDDLDAAFASYLIRYRFMEDIVRPEWVRAMLSAPQLRRQLESLAASSAGQYNLSLGKLDPLPIPVPSLDEQDARLRQLSSLTEDAGRLDHAVRANQRRATGLRRSLLAAAFCGQVTQESDVQGAGALIST